MFANFRVCDTHGGQCTLKREKQILISKNMIKDALFEILMEKDFRDITISEITRRAKVGRMTFYRNFSRKEEIVVFFFGAAADS